MTSSVRALLACTAVCALAACTNYNPLLLTPQVGVSTGVALSTAGSITTLLVGQTLELSATVESVNDTAGVTWTLTGVGTLTGNTNSTVTYVAPSEGIVGSQTALITATSIANPTKYASTALVVFGTPVIPPQSIFPGNVNVGYQSPISAAGGDQPFTWTVSAGTLPPGLSLSGSTSSSTYIEGTPTAAGTFNFTLQATDSLSRLASQTFTMTVKPQSACLLAGHYTLLSTGYRGGSEETHAASINIDPVTGNITGEQDYKDGVRTTPAEVLTSGSCQNRATNTGLIALSAPSGQLVYNFSAAPPDSSGTIHSAALGLIHSGSDGATGVLLLQDLSNAPPAPISGNYAFGLFTVGAGEKHFGTIGRFTSSSAGAISAGVVDSNGPTPLTGQGLTGVASAPDAYGRGTLTLQMGGQTMELAYYQVNASKMMLMDIDPISNTATGPIRMGGQMTAQVGNVSATNFDNNALATPSVVSQFGQQGTIDPITVMSLGRLSGADATAGTVNLVLDTSDLANPISAVPYNAQPFSIATNGRGTLTLSSSTGARPFVFYLDGTSNGYILEHGSAAGSTGLLEAQYQGPYAFPPSSGIFPATMQNAFVSYTGYPQAMGPMTLNSLLYLTYDSLTSNYVNGSFAIDPNTGRGLGTVTVTGVAAVSAAIYVVSPTKMDMLNFGTQAVDGSIDFIIQ